MLQASGAECSPPAVAHAVCAAAQKRPQREAQAEMAKGHGDAVRGRQVAAGLLGIVSTFRLLCPT